MCVKGSLSQGWNAHQTPARHLAVVTPRVGHSGTQAQMRITKQQEITFVHLDV